MVVAVTRAEDHAHDPDMVLAKRGLLLRDMHKKIQRNPTVPVRRLTAVYYILGNIHPKFRSQQHLIH